jgi:hypothetical protein
MDRSSNFRDREPTPLDPTLTTLSTQPLKANIKDRATIRTNLQDTLANVHTIKNKIQTV